MRIEIRDRVLEEARYILITNKTIRATAEEFGVSKSTVHVDISERLKKIDKVMYNNLKKILERNFTEKHIRGGDATRNKYLSEKNKKIKLFNKKTQRLF